MFTAQNKNHAETNDNGYLNSGMITIIFKSHGKLCLKPTNNDFVMAIFMVNWVNVHASKTNDSLIK